MSEQLTLGVIGAGMIGKKHITCVQQDGRARVTWVCNRSADSARQTAQQYAVPRFSAQYHDLLNDGEVQAVIIATPPYLHAEMLEAALSAGKHVLLEKPMAASLDDVARIKVAAAAHPDRIVLDASCRDARLQPKFAFVKSSSSTPTSSRTPGPTR